MPLQLTFKKTPKTTKRISNGDFLKDFLSEEIVPFLLEKIYVARRVS